MKLTYDPGHNVAYLYLVDEPLPNSVAVTVRNKDGNLQLDFDREGHLIGIEFLDAEGTLTKGLLATAGTDPADSALPWVPR